VGTGFFISPEGLVLTAYHVVDPSTNFPGEVSLEALGPDGARYALELVGFDAFRDLALLKAVGVEDVPFLPLAAATPRVGSEVVAIGNSRRDFLQGRAGEVRRLNVRAIQTSFADGTFELSAALAPGDSGGPVVNAAGEAVGVVSYIAFAPRATSSVPQPGLFPTLQTVPSNNGYAAYAVPVGAEDATLDALRAGEQRDIPVIGFSIGVPGLRQSYDPRISGDLGLGRFPGVIVGNVAPDSPAAAAGLRSAVQEPVYDENGTFVTVRNSLDVIVSVDGERTPTYDALVEVLRRKRVGQEVEVQVQRGEEQFSVRLELGWEANGLRRLRHRRRIDI
jgi:S1-C subfamily serine protease